MRLQAARGTDMGWVFLFPYLWLQGPEGAQYRLENGFKKLQAGWGKHRAYLGGPAFVRDAEFLDGLSSDASASGSSLGKNKHPLEKSLLSEA